MRKSASVYLSLLILFQFSFGVTPPEPSDPWIKYQQEHRFSRAYLVLAGPYPSSPSSAFGHLFLLLEPAREDSVPMPLWRVVNFAARDDSVNAFEKFYKGILGGLDGEMQIVPLYEKLRDYSFIESRDLWLFPIRLTTEQSDVLLRQIYQLSTKKFPYRFFSNNCATQIANLLQSCVATNKTGQRSPRDVIYHFANYLDEPIIIESVEKQLQKIKGAEAIEASWKTSSAPPDARSARILLTILEWKLFQNKIDMNVGLREKMNALRLVLAQTEPDPTLTTRVISQPFHMHPPSLLSVGMASGVNERIETRLTTRMGLHSPFDGIGIYSKYDFLKFMEFEIAIRRGIVQLERFLIFDQISTPPATFLSRRPSWRFVLGAQRYRQLPGNSLLSGITLGYGYAAQTFRKKISAALMLEAISGYSRKTGFNLLTEPVMRIGFFPFKRIRFYSELRATEDIRDKQWKFYPGSDISLTVDLNDHSRLRLSAELNQNANLLAIYLAHYLN